MHFPVCVAHVAEVCFNSLIALQHGEVAAGRGPGQPLNHLSLDQLHSGFRSLGTHHLDGEAGLWHSGTEDSHAKEGTLSKEVLPPTGKPHLSGLCWLAFPHRDLNLRLELQHSVDCVV